MTLRGYKFEKKEGCVYVGQKAIYHGPYKAITDEEGHLFPRNEPVEVCTDTAAKLRKPPYAGQFTILRVDIGPLIQMTRIPYHTAAAHQRKAFLVVNHKV